MQIEQLSKAKRILFLCALFLSNLIVMADLVLSPTINALYERFPLQIGLVNFIVSGMYLVVVIVSPVVSRLMKMWSKKRLLIIGAVMSSIGGCLLMFREDALWMAVMRGIMAVGYTFTYVSSLAVFTDIYSDEAKRSTVIGYNNAVNNLIGVIFSLLAGNLAMISIKAAYQIYWIYPVYLLLVILFVPNYKPVTTNDIQEDKQAVAGKKEKLGFRFWRLLLTSCLFVIVFNCSNFFVSMYITENGGNISMVGTLNSVNTAIAFVSAFFFGKLYAKFGKKLLALDYLVAGIGVTLLWLFSSQANTWIGYMLIGGTYAIEASFIFSYCPIIVPASRVEDAIAYITAMQTFFGFLCSYIVTFSMSALNTNFTGSLIVIVIVAAAAVLIEFFVGQIEDKVAVNPTQGE